MRAVLVLLGGAPASGKSTLARRWCDSHGDRLPLALDLDVLRAMLGGWREARTDAGVAARAMALAAIEVHLRAGRDVLVPQFLARPEFIDALADVAARSGAGFLECALVIDPDVALARHRSRATSSVLRGRPDDEGDLEEPLTVVHQRFAAFLTTRPGVVLVDPEDPDVLSRLDDLVERARSRAGSPMRPASPSGS